MRARTVLALVAVGCSGGPAPRPAQPEAKVEAPRPAETASSWAVSWERTLGWLSSPPLIAGDGELMSGGVRFGADGRYLGMSPAQVPGGRLISTIHARLADGRVVATATGGENGDEVIVTRLDSAPELASARVKLYVEAIDVFAGRIAVNTATDLVVLSLPDLKEVERVELGRGPGYKGVGLFDGGVLFTRDRALVARRGDQERVLVRDGVELAALSPARDVAAVVTGKKLQVIEIPGGEVVARATVGDDVGALAVAPGGRSVAVVECKTLVILDRRDGERTFEPGFRGRFTEDGCPYVSGARFDAAGDRLAVAGRELTVLDRGGAAAERPLPAYRPIVPEGFVARAGDPSPLELRPGSGLARTPRELASFEYGGDDLGWAWVTASVRDASQLAHLRGLDAWSEAVLVRFESMLRDERDPNRFADPGRDVLPYHRAFVDRRGRRNLEYALYQRDGCEPHDRYVRFVEDGPDLLRVSMTTVVGLDPALARPWLRHFLDDPLGGADGRVLARKLPNRGGC